MEAGFYPWLEAIPDPSQANYRIWVWQTRATAERQAADMDRHQINKIPEVAVVPQGLVNAQGDNAANDPNNQPARQRQNRNNERERAEQNNRELARVLRREYEHSPTINFNDQELHQVLALLTAISDLLDKIDSTNGSIRSYQRSNFLLSRSSDRRPVGCRYIQKEEIVPISIRIGDNIRPALSNVAHQIAAAFVGQPAENQSIESYTRYYEQRMCWNMSAEEKSQYLVGTVTLAQEIIIQIHQELELPLTNNMNRLGIWISSIKRLINNVGQTIDTLDRYDIPKLLTIFVGCAGLSYGIFGVRALKPAKLGFLFRHIL